MNVCRGRKISARLAWHFLRHFRKGEHQSAQTNSDVIGQDILGNWLY
jgi:hypothetical protein